ncbi:MAG TPA: Na+/H+ antiporter NhaA [Rhodospirillaceae bacterium]|nr:Na+/H+ antiporter NhaA [Rhodospirillaceae bacterium]
MTSIRQFFSSAIAPGILLCLATLCALVVANTGFYETYNNLLTRPVFFHQSLLFIINDGLMAIFFLLIGLEVKREMATGHLSSIKNAMLPLLAAAGGAIVPAILYILVNNGDAEAMKGWAIPTATDIAFALGIMMLLGSRVPNSLKVCLVTIAVVDDLFAVIIIALFYTANISLLPLLFALAGLGSAALLNRYHVTRLLPYLLIGLFVWFCVLQSGLHPTLAGVAIGLIIPIKIRHRHGENPSTRLEHALHPWVSFIILPVFAFANAGVSLAGLSFGAFLHPITLGIMLGLFFGKQAGIMLATKIACRLGVAELPAHSTWRQYYGMALLTGIGFTMSLFIGNLAFTSGDQAIEVKLGVLSGSLLSAIAGILLLLSATRKEKMPDQT